LIAAVHFQTPEDFDIPAINWNGERIQQYLKTVLRITLTISAVYKWLRRLKLTLQRPRANSAHPDPKAKAKFIADLDQERKEAADRDIFMATDEAILSETVTVKRRWAWQGCQPTIIVQGGHTHQPIFGLVIPTEGIARFAYSPGNINAKRFRHFLKLILQEYPGKKVHLILDNSRAHRAKLVQKFADEHEDQIKLDFLPAYSSDMDPIERLWEWMRQDHVHNYQDQNFAMKCERVGNFLKTLKAPTNQVKSMCHWEF
jgi:transposase